MSPQIDVLQLKSGVEVRIWYNTQNNAWSMVMSGAPYCFNGKYHHTWMESCFGGPYIPADQRMMYGSTLTIWLTLLGTNTGHRVFLPRPIGVVTGNKHNNPLLRYHFRIRSEKIYDLWLTTFFFVVETWGCFNKISQETKPLTDYHCWFVFFGKVYRFCHAFLTK